jgi:hypothetical protein
MFLSRFLTVCREFITFVVTEGLLPDVTAYGLAHGLRGHSDSRN